MAITRKVNSGIKIIEARIDEDVSLVPSHQVRYITLERCGLPRRSLERHEGSPYSLSQSHEGKKGISLMPSFSSTLEMSSFTTTSQAPRSISMCLFTIFLEEIIGAQPQSQLGGHPPRVTSSRSLTRTNRGGELNTMQWCKARTLEVFKSFTLKSHPNNKC